MRAFKLHLQKMKFYFIFGRKSFCPSFNYFRNFFCYLLMCGDVSGMLDICVSISCDKLALRAKPALVGHMHQTEVEFHLLKTEEHSPPAQTTQVWAEGKWHLAIVHATYQCQMARWRVHYLATMPLLCVARRR